MQTQPETPSATTPSDVLLDFLLNPASYPHHPDRVRLVQTHMSLVLLVSPYAYKVKKPVNLGFADFSTLEKRHYYAEREIALNRRLCAETYLDVVPISWRSGHLVFGEGEETIEYAVRMRELNEQYFLLRLLERNEVGPREMHQIARKLADFYSQQTPTEEIARWGRVENLRISTDENFAQTEEGIGKVLTRPAFEAIRAYTNGFYRHHQQRFEQRIRENRILDCHGDLHLDHIHCGPRGICIYDCIEFNDRLRSIDVANDVAFLAMDLDYAGHADLARSFISQTAYLLKDSGLFHLIDFYQCYRAYVRGKVEMMRSNAPQVAEADRQQSYDQSRRYFRLALNYAVAGSGPAVLVVMGRIGSGKSTLAHELARELGWEVYSSDVVRKEMAGLPIDASVPDEVREQLYHPAAKEQVYAALIQRAIQQVRAGKRVILDATFGQKADRRRVREQLEQAGASGSFLEVQAPETTIRQRLAHREPGTAYGSDARLEDFDRLSHAYEPPAEIHPLYLQAVTTEQPLDEAVMMALIGMAHQQILRPSGGPPVTSDGYSYPD
ncbi:MAG: AAA family ATPase [Chloroflexaceae bacterium]|nr:AAA family ATPase [Chloroflexaceae bacterium]